MPRPGSARFAFTAMLLMAGCSVGAQEPHKAERAPAPQAQPGDVALDYISSDTYPSLLVEVDYVKGSEPSPEAVERLREALRRRLDKPGRVEVLPDSEIPFDPQRTRYQVGDLLALEAQYRRNHTGDAGNRGQAVIWVVYLNGESEFDVPGTRALGVAYDASSIAVFRDSIERTAPAEVRDVVEAIVLVHEAGHLFGLVNNGLPMATDHEDPENPRHDASAACVMAHRIDTANVKRLLFDPPLDFDYACRLDLAAAGGLDPGQPDASPVAVETKAAPPPARRGRPGPLMARGTVLGH